MNTRTDSDTHTNMYKPCMLYKLVVYVCVNVTRKITDSLLVLSDLGKVLVSACANSSYQAFLSPPPGHLVMRLGEGHTHLYF